ncbi:uncharacterized protein [Dermacentor albipictus]|uniref:uncharacterized protein isoform X2 n=1 Tax=Dermacentor albipictus TaxID=60249 RepID=UPI0038FCDEE2
MMDYNPSESWPFPILAQFIEIREKRGFHQIYTNGFIRTSDYEIELPKYYYNGWTARVFMRRSKELPSVSIEIVYNSGWYCKTLINDSENAIRTSTSGNEPDNHAAMGPEANAGSIYSMGIRLVKDFYLMSVANEASGTPQSMKTSLKGYRYDFKISSRTDVILSVHMSEEIENNYVSLPRYFDLLDTKHPPGSSIVALVKCTDPGAETTFYLDNDSKHPEDLSDTKGLAPVKFKTVHDLKKDQEFYVYVRNLPHRYTVATSFSPEPRPIDHKAGKDNICFYNSDNCTTLSLIQPQGCRNKPLHQARRVEPPYLPACCLSVTHRYSAGWTTKTSKTGWQLTRRFAGRSAAFVKPGSRAR